jgi:ribonuclease VapC
MVVDTSALIAIAWDEPERVRFQDAIERDPTRLLPDACVLAAAILMMRRAGRLRGPEALDNLHRLVEQLGLEIEPLTIDQIRLAEQAYLVYGKGLHQAGLNFGDCFAYALAKETGELLLFKGDDFSRTDLRPAGTT